VNEPIRDKESGLSNAERAPKLKLVSQSTYLKEAALKNLFLVCACVAVAGVALIFVFVGWRGWPVFSEIGVGKFLLGKEWLPTEQLFGILPLFVGSLVVTIGALALGTPLAVGTAVFLSEIASHRVRAIVRPAVELLAGFPRSSTASSGCWFCGPSSRSSPAAWGSALSLRGSCWLS